MNAFNISFMEHNDLEAAASVLSHAMLNNPLHLAVFRGNGETERLMIEKMFLELLRERPGIVFIAKERHEIICVMRMISCVGKKTAEEGAEPKDEKDISKREAFWLNEWAKRDPKEQHWHLGPIGVLPSHRKGGVGSQLMQRFCSEVDNCHADAYLETDLDENVRFYQKFGFEIVSKSNILQVDSKYMVRKYEKQRENKPSGTE